MARTTILESQHRVSWSSEEKSKIIEHALTLRQARPDLAGLPLLRSAINVLPLNRRRKVISVSQVAWFEPWLADAVRCVELEKKLHEVAGRMAIVHHEDDPAVTILKSTNEATVKAVDMLGLVHHELRKLNDNLGTPAPKACSGDGE